jgi:hypothetical protein
MSEAEYVYRVIRNDGMTIWEGRGSDPFTRRASARARATKLNNERIRWGEDHPGYKVQRAVVEWEDDTDE